MLWGGRWEGGSCLGTHVRIKDLKKLKKKNNSWSAIKTVIREKFIVVNTYVKKWRRKWQPNPVFLPGESHGGRSPVGYSPWGHKELDMTE